MSCCPDCGGSGFVVQEHANGISSAAPCSCRQVRVSCQQQQPRATSDEYAAAVELMAHMVPFFPKDDMSHAFIASELVGWCKSKSDLHRFTRFVCTSVEKWDGLAGLWRAYEQRLEGDFKQATMDDSSRRLEGYREEFRLLSASERAQAETAKDEIGAQLALIKGIASCNRSASISPKESEPFARPISTALHGEARTPADPMECARIAKSCSTPGDT